MQNRTERAPRAPPLLLPWGVLSGERAAKGSSGVRGAAGREQVSPAEMADSAELGKPGARGLGAKHWG